MQSSVSSPTASGDTVHPNITTSDAFTSAPNTSLVPTVSPNTQHLHGELFHGQLEVEINYARNLSNPGKAKNCVPVVGALNPDETTNPFVEVIVHDTVHVRSSTRRNTLFPVWNERHSLPICQRADHVTIRVSHHHKSDHGDPVFLGQVKLSAKEIVKHASGACGLDGIFALSDSPTSNATNIHEACNNWDDEDKYRRLRRKPCVMFKLRLTPVAELMTAVQRCKSDCAKLTHEQCAVHVPSAYFPVRSGKRWKLYQSSSQKGQLGTITPTEIKDGELYKSSNLWTDISEAIQGAKEFICITGLELNPNLQLVRTVTFKDDNKDGEQNILREEEEEETPKGPTVGELLKQKADEENVLVMILLWDDLSLNTAHQTGDFVPNGNSCETYFEGSNVCVVNIGKTSPHMVEGEPSDNGFVHHQTSIVMDSHKLFSGKLRNIGNVQSGRPSHLEEVVAYVGSIDLATGRYDNTDKALFTSLENLHKDDFLNRLAPSVTESLGPRQPWQGIHAKVMGLAAVDVLQNFLERWTGEAGTGTFGISAKLYKTMEKLGINTPRDRLNYFGKRLVHRLRNTCAQHAIPTRRYGAPTRLIMAPDEEVIHPGTTDLQTSTEEARQLERDLGAGFSCQLVRSIDSNSVRMLPQVSQPIVEVVDYYRMVDKSLYHSYVHHIRRAKHFLYLETSSFIGSCNMWSEAHDKTCATNVIPGEIAQKICSKIRRGKLFHAYIVIPMFPQGNPQDYIVQQQLRWQYLTIESMYRCIGEELMYQQLLRSASGQSVEPEAMLKPEDYLTFYCLGQREVFRTSTSMQDEDELDQVDESVTQSLQDRLLRTRRFPIYVGSKLLIVDDEVAIVGSGTVSQRSFSGQRDTELAMVLFESHYLATSTHTPRGEVYGFRMSLWAEHMGDAKIPRGMHRQDLVRDPSSRTSVKYVRDLADENWKKYAGKRLEQLSGHLLRYPLRVLDLPPHQPRLDMATMDTVQSEWDFPGQARPLWTGSVLEPVCEEFPDFNGGFVVGDHKTGVPTTLA